MKIYREGTKLVIEFEDSDLPVGVPMDAFIEAVVQGGSLYARIPVAVILDTLPKIYRHVFELSEIVEDVKEKYKVY